MQAMAWRFGHEELMSRTHHQVIQTLPALLKIHCHAEQHNRWRPHSRKVPPGVGRTSSTECRSDPLLEGGRSQGSSRGLENCCPKSVSVGHWASRLKKARPA